MSARSRSDAGEPTASPPGGVADGGKRDGPAGPEGGGEKRPYFGWDGWTPGEGGGTKDAPGGR